MPPFFSLVCVTLRTAFPTENGGFILTPSVTALPCHLPRGGRLIENAERETAGASPRPTGLRLIYGRTQFAPTG